MSLAKITFIITFDKAAVAGAETHILVGRADIKKGPPNHPYRIKLVKKFMLCKNNTIFVQIAIVGAPDEFGRVPEAFSGCGCSLTAQRGAR